MTHALIAPHVEKVKKWYEGTKIAHALHALTYFDHNKIVRDQRLTEFAETAQEVAALMQTELDRGNMTQVTRALNQLAARVDGLDRALRDDIRRRELREQL